MQTYLILLSSILFAVAAQLLLKKGMLILGPLSFDFKTILLLIKSFITNLYIFFSLVLLGLSFLGWLVVVSRVKLSTTYPMVTLIYVLVILGAHFIYKEPISFYQIIGMVLIFGGVFLLFK